MIVYFTDRHMNVLGQASTSLPFGFSLLDDEKIEDTDTGVASFSCYVTFEEGEQLEVGKMTCPGNYILRKHNNENEFYTIIESESDPESHEIYIYAEDAGLDLLNEVAEAYEAAEAHPIEWYIEKWTVDSGFEIGLNEISDLSRKLKWDGETTVTERLASIATQFDNAEISYSFDIEGLTITHRYINIHKKRGKDIGEELRVNKNLNNIRVKRSVANLATALEVTGGTTEGSENPITLKGYKYDDGDFYVDAGGVLKSRKAVEKWARYCWENKIPGYEGHIKKTYSFDTTNQKTLCAHAVTELKSICDIQVNYEADIAELPESIRIGDRVNLVDDSAELYVSARFLQLKTYITKNNRKAVFGEYLIKDSGIDDKVEALASQFAELAKNKTFYTWIAYADDENGNGISLDSDGKAYIGFSANRTKAEADITDPTVYKWSKVEGNDGKSLAGVTEHYLVSDLTEGVTIESGGWVTSPIPTMTATKKYLWNYETLVYSDESIVNLEPKIIGAYGDAGTSSPAIVNMSEQYYLSLSATELTGGEWIRTIPDWVSGKYLWTRWCIEWDEPNPDILTYSEPVVATSFNEIHEIANDAATAADDAKKQADSAKTQVEAVNKELAEADKQLQSLTQNLETLQQTMTADYATKGELTNVSSSLGTRIDQNAAQISSTATKVKEIEVDAGKAISDAAAAQSAAEQAKQNAQDAQAKYSELKGQADATDEQLAAAKEAVDEAQAAAIAAGDAAAAAQSAIGSLTDRISTAETNIKQNADQIEQTAKKIDKLKIGGRNLILDSDIAEESTEYGFGEMELSVPLESDTEYTFSANGKVTAGDVGKYLVVNLASDDQTFIQTLNITETTDTTKSVTFTTPAGMEDKVVKVMCYYAPHSPEGATFNGSCTVNWVKLEKGNKPTDWTPAPEDGKNFTTESISETASQILQTAEEITINILKGYTTASDLEEYKKQIENIFKVNEEGFAFEFKQLKDKLTEVGNEVVERNQFIRLENGNIIIGKSDSPIQALFTNNTLEFRYNDQTVAKFTNEVLEVRNIAVDNQVRFWTDWAIRKGTYVEGKGYNLNDVWIGG